MVMDALALLQWATFVATVFMILSGIPPSYDVYKTKDASRAPVLFFLLAIANAIGWLHYGYLIGNFNLVSLNCLGLILNTVYVLLYLAYSPDWSDFSYKFTALLAYFSALHYHLNWLSGDDFMAHLGASCSLVNVIFMLLPVLDIARMLSSRDVGKTHLSILFAGTLCSALWSLYGQAIGDNNVVLPNLIGVTCSVACLVVRFYVQASGAKEEEVQEKHGKKRLTKKQN